LPWFVSRARILDIHTDHVNLVRVHQESTAIASTVSSPPVTSHYLTVHTGLHPQIVAQRGRRPLVNQGASMSLEDFFDFTFNEVIEDG